jgi:uncharacterized protein (DUF488 family)
MKIFTIGHSNHSIGTFIGLLKRNSITAIADVRSYPYSRIFPHFNRDIFRASLKEVGIEYVFLGDNLGARPQDRACYVGNMAVYDLIAANKNFSLGIDRLTKGAEKYQISLMCAEQDPIICHRAILVCQHLRKSGLEIRHILKAGNLENHENLEERLLKLHHLDKMLTSPIDCNDENNDAKQLSLFDDLKNHEEHRTVSLYRKR